MRLTLRVFICICPNIVSGNLVTMWSYFFYHLFFLAQIVTHIWREKAKICSTFAFKFFLKFWTFVGSIQSSFLFSFQKYNFFWNRTKIDVFTMFFPWNYFLCGRILSFSGIVIKMWIDCESQCERNSAHIVTHNIRWHQKSSHNTFTFCWPFSKKEGILPQKFNGKNMSILVWS